jgi:hypothetical protein
LQRDYDKEINWNGGKNDMEWRRELFGNEGREGGE